ncbi:MAG TPA: tetratricopeptide repeat protein, partial [Blastocatellia bacterium]|nr:tetratricopeptide repeat protein [Blastocatellia bacterium]
MWFGGINDAPRQNAERPEAGLETKRRVNHSRCSVFRLARVWHAAALLPLLFSMVSAQRSTADSAASYIERGNALFKRGDFDRAIADFSMAIAFDPRSATAYYNRGNTHRVRGEWDEALSDYDKVVEIDPKMSSGFANRGAVRFFKGDLTGAIVDYEIALRLDPR